jgi:hypothetical protein
MNRTIPEGEEKEKTNPGYFCDRTLKTGSATFTTHDRPGRRISSLPVV